ncbi:MAG: AraC family transcriptional regulator [Myxococcales bacterium]|nr:AraC family transcriptional regulator [Myxococcales bacterium]
MALLQRRRLLDGDDLSVARVTCDGRDHGRLRDEAWPGDQLVVVLRGDFALRHRLGRGFADVRTAVLARGGRPFVMSHPRGRGDVCLSFSGSTISRLLDERDVTEVQFRHTNPSLLLEAGDADSALAWHSLLAGAFSDGDADDDPRPASLSDRQIAEAIGYVLAARYDEPLRLEELAREAAVSPFWACRAFKRATGTTIHGALEELRLRHALAAIVDGDEPLADVAQACGFANHGHLTNRFHRRFAATPTALRRRYRNGR